MISDRIECDSLEGKTVRKRAHVERGSTHAQASERAAKRAMREFLDILAKRIGRDGHEEN